MKIWIEMNWNSLVNSNKNSCYQPEFLQLIKPYIIISKGVSMLSFNLWTRVVFDFEMDCSSLRRVLSLKGVGQGIGKQARRKNGASYCPFLFVGTATVNEQVFFLVTTLTASFLYMTRGLSQPNFRTRYQNHKLLFWFQIFCFDF